MTGFRNHTNPFRCIAKDCSICFDQPSRGMHEKFLLFSICASFFFAIFSVTMSRKLSFTAFRDMICDVPSFVF